MFSARIGFFQGAAAAAPQDVLFTTATTPYIYSYAWTDATGYGTKYSNPTAASGNGRGITVKTDNSVVFMSSTTTPYIHAWAYTVGTGFGSKYSNPGTTGGSNPEEVAWNNTTSSIISCDSASPYLNAWAWSSGFGTKYSNPGTSVGGACDAVRFNFAGDVVATGPSVSPYIVAYAWSSSGFGTKFSNPATLPTQEIFGISFGLNDNFMAVSSNTLRTYQWNNSTGFGSTISTVTHGGDSQGSSLNGIGTYLFNGDDTNGQARSYSITSSGTITSTATSTVSSNQGFRGVAVNKKTDASIVFPTTNTPYQLAYPLTGSGGTFGTKYANPATILNGTGRDAVFTN